MNIGRPQFHLCIPYGSNQWYLVVTSEGRHFYFNKDERKSYWQISDFSDKIDKQVFLDSINYDEVALLMARSNGFVVKKKEEEQNHKGSEKEKEREVEEVTVESSEEEVDYGDANDVIRGLLEEEGMLQEEEKSDDEPVEEEVEDEDEVDDPQQKQAGLNLGYSLSEEDSENEEVEEKVQRQENDEGIEDDDEVGTEVVDGVDETETAFLSLLDTLSDRISIYDPWFLVEEQLINEFAQLAEYYAVEEDERERLFDQWVSSQEKVAVVEPVTKTFPTSTQKYLQFLQLNKDAMKKLDYGAFRARFKQETDIFGLSPRALEDIFRIYKKTVSDFNQYEREHKKNNPGINLKKQRLEQFLETSNLQSRPFVDIEGDFFEKWINVCNCCNVPITVAESPVNFLVGDEKRYQAYHDCLSKK